MKCSIRYLTVCLTGLSLAAGASSQTETRQQPTSERLEDRDWQEPGALHREVPNDPWMPRPETAPAGVIEHCEPWERGPFKSIQVNVDENGCNIPGDAANEPSIAIDPTDPNRMVIGWRQFDSVESDFRQAGWAYSHDGGQTWTFPGVLEPGQFRSDPVLDSDADGNFYFYSLSSAYSAEMFRSTDGGVTWRGPVPAGGGDKPWMAIDKTAGIGRGNIYCGWNFDYSCCSHTFVRSIDSGLTFWPVSPGWTYWGTIAVGPEGELYSASKSDGRFRVQKSTNARDPEVPWPSFSGSSVRVDLGGRMDRGGPPNPSGLLGQVWVATDHSDGPSRGNVYLLCSVESSWYDDPLDVMFARSTDEGSTWSEPVRVNDDPIRTKAWQWFGTMSVAPSGRIDVIWNDTRNGSEPRFSELFYAYSVDEGLTWSRNIPVSPMFDSRVGWPQQSKLGDYYHMISDRMGGQVAYAATFNGEQDVYFLRIDLDCNGNGVHDGEDMGAGTSRDCNANDVPDECDITSVSSADADENGVPDECEVTAIFVKDDADGLNHGTTWKDAYTDLHHALYVAGCPETQASQIWVAEGVYKPAPPNGRRWAGFGLVNGVTLYGGFAGHEASLDERDWVKNVTVLDGDLNSDDPEWNSSNCCIRHEGEGCDVPACQSAVCAIDQTCCNARIASWDCDCVDLAASVCGDCCGLTCCGSWCGLTCSQRSDNVYHVVIANETDYSAVLDGFTVRGGNADGDPMSSDPERRAQAYGGGLHVTRGSATVRNCIFRGNAGSMGGGIGVYAIPRPPVPQAFTATNCLFEGNVGGGVCIGQFGAGALVNCHVIRNTGRGAWAIDVRELAIQNCIFWGNTAGWPSDHCEAQVGYPTGSMTYSCIQGCDEPWWGGGVGIIDEDPRFADPIGPDGIPGTGDEDLRLVSGSPCIDAGDNVGAPAAVTDLAGQPRLVDDPDTPDTGNGEPPIVDMGAYEFQPVLTGMLDIKPGSCPNPLNPRSKGLVPLACVGSDVFDVTQVELPSLALGRADGIGESVTPLLRGRGQAITTEDVAAPFEGELCDCHNLGPDGIEDLVLKFSTQELATAFQLDSLRPGTSIALTLTGWLLDGTHFAASDCIIITGGRQEPSLNRASIGRQKP
ncbi:MAG: right-handed parallel beta-helix repeat-containing protein [Phycisphaerales bacterium]|nr:MAG: right-handed parallel beta-helix repeat-containing protein [Phycisphaerales bacterium]